MQTNLDRYNAQMVALNELKGMRENQNKKVLYLLKTADFVPNEILIKVSKQYNRSIWDLRQKGYVINSIKKDGTWGKMYIGFDLRKALENGYNNKK